MNPMLSSILQKISAAILGKGWTHRRYLILYARSNIPPRDTLVRFAFSSLLRLRCNDKVLLVRNSHRPETFSPLGGVIKYHSKALTTIDKWEVQFQTSPDPFDMIHDLRGFIPKKHLPLLLQWYYSDRDRESSEQCLQREMIEELKELEVSDRFPPKFHFRHIRAVVEPLRYLPITGYSQYRMFDVWEPDDEHSDMSNICDAIIHNGRVSRNFVLATTEEVFAGRTDTGELIAPIARYLFASAPILDMMPMLRTCPNSS